MELKVSINKLSLIFAILAFIPSMSFAGDILLRHEGTSQYNQITGKTAQALFRAIKPDGTEGRLRGYDVPTKELLGTKLFCIDNSESLDSAHKYICHVSKSLTPAEIAHIFKHLDVPQITTNIPSRNLKIIGELMILSSHNDDNKTIGAAMPAEDNNKILYQHPCKNADTLPKAKRCMAFWANVIYQRNDGANPYNVVVSDETTQRMLSQIMSVNGATRRAIGDAVSTARASQFLSYVGTFSGHFTITYFALDNQNILRPVEIYQLKTANTPNIHREYLERIFGEQDMTWKEILKGYTCAVLLGGRASEHNGFKDYVDDISDRFNGRL